MQLSTHFALDEFTFSATAVRNGIVNDQPPAEVMANLTTLAFALEQVRDTLGGHAIRIDSGYRCEALERILCVKDFRNWCARRGISPNTDNWPLYFATKAHPKGFAADILCPDFGDPATIVKAIAASGIPFDQCIMEGTWVHFSVAPEMRHEVLTATFGADGPTYTEGLA